MTGLGAAIVLVALSWLMPVEPAAARSSHHRSHAAPIEETATKPKDAVAASQVPLPQSRPAEAPARASTEAATAKDEAGKGGNKGDNKEDAKNSAKDEAAAPPPPPSACRIALTDEVAIAPSVPSIHGPGECGGDDLVRLEAVVLPNKKRVALTPTGIMRCTMATAVVNWIRNDVAPEVAKLGSEITTLDNFDSYECRGRNGVPSAKLSEHGRANAIDVHGFKLADGRLIELTDRTQPREFREAVLHSACTRFPTVLGPDSDFHHEDHIHVDLIERRNNYRICQWDVLDQMPKVAPLIPEVRPDNAPPRELAEAAKPGDKTKDQATAKGNDAKGDDAKSSDTKGKDTKGKDADKPSKVGDDKAGNDAAGKEKAGRDAKQDTKPATDKAVKETGSETSVTSKPASPPASSAPKLPAETAGKDKPENKPAAEPGKAAADHAAPDKSSISKSSSDKASTDKTSTEKASSNKTSTDKTSTDKPSRKKIAADRPASKKRRHRAREWNPFAGFF